MCVVVLFGMVAMIVMGMGGAEGVGGGEGAEGAGKGAYALALLDEECESVWGVFEGETGEVVERALGWKVVGGEEGKPVVSLVPGVDAVVELEMYAPANQQVVWRARPVEGAEGEGEVFSVRMGIQLSVEEFSGRGCEAHFEYFVTAEDDGFGLPLAEIAQAHAEGLKAAVDVAIMHTDEL